MLALAHRQASIHHVRSSGVLIGVTVLSGGLASLLSIPLNTWALSGGSSPTYFAPDVFLLGLSVVTGVFPFWLARRQAASPASGRSLHEYVGEVEEARHEAAYFYPAQSGPTFDDGNGVHALSETASPQSTPPLASTDCDVSASDVNLAVADRPAEGMVV